MEDFYKNYGSADKKWIEETAQNIMNSNQKDEKRNLKSWAVKLPEEVIEEIEKLHKASGLRFKNEFIEYLLKQYKVNLFKEGEQSTEILHPEVLKNSESDVHELGKLTQMMHEVFINRLEKESLLQYELERTKNDYQALLEKYRVLEDRMNEEIGETLTPSYLDTSIRQTLRKGFGHRIFVGVSGSGKTKAAMWEIKHAVEQKRQVIVFDPTSEYEKMTTAYGGSNYQLFSNQSTLRINPFEVSPSTSLTHKILENLTLIQLLLRREVNAQERKVLINALEIMYQSFGITKDEVKKIETMPTFTDFNKFLSGSEKGLLLAEELEPFISGFLHYFNGERNFHVYNSPMITFNIHGTERELSEASAFTTLSFIYQMIKEGVFKNTLLVIDEIWMFMQQAPLRDLLMSVVKEGKKYGLELLLVTQTMQDIESQFDLLSNMGTKVYFRQTGNGVKFLSEQAILPTVEAKLLESLQAGEVFIDGQIKFMMRFNVMTDFDEKPRDILY